MSKLILEEWVKLRFPNLRAEQVVDYHFHLIKAKKRLDYVVSD